MAMVANVQPQSSLSRHRGRRKIPRSASALTLLSSAVFAALGSGTLFTGLGRGVGRSVSVGRAGAGAEVDETVTWSSLSLNVRSIGRGDPTPWPEYVKSDTATAAPPEASGPAPVPPAPAPAPAPVPVAETPPPPAPSPEPAPVMEAPAPAPASVAAPAAAAPEEEAREGMKVWQLRELAEKRGLDSTGAKGQLLERLRAAPSVAAAAAPEPAAPVAAPVAAPEPAAESAPAHAPAAAGSAGSNQGITSMKGLRVGQKLQGKVTKLFPFGALVDVGVENMGMVRGTRMAADHQVQNVNNVLKVGQEMDVWVYRVPNNGKLGLCGMEWPESELKDPFSAFQTVSRSEWFEATVRYHSEAEGGFYVDVDVPNQNGAVQGFLHSRVGGDAVVGERVKVRVLRPMVESGTVDVSALPVPSPR